jgi:hypothetical protein
MKRFFGKGAAQSAHNPLDENIRTEKAHEPDGSNNHSDATPESNQALINLDQEIEQLKETHRIKREELKQLKEFITSLESELKQKKRERRSLATEMPTEDFQPGLKEQEVEAGDSSEKDNDHQRTHNLTIMSQCH